MKLNQGGTTTSGKVVHAVYGEWSYTSPNRSWCGRLLGSTQSRMVGHVEVTCKSCVRVTPTFDQRIRDTAFELLRSHRLGFALTASSRELARYFPDWSEGSVKLAQMVLSSAVPEPVRSGVGPCGCRDCFDNTMHSDLSRPGLCHECHDADCNVNDGECQRSDAYGL